MKFSVLQPKLPKVKKEKKKVYFRDIYLKVKAFFVFLPGFLWRNLKYIVPELIVIAVMLTLDLVSKYLISINMGLHETKVLIPNFLEFYYTLNPTIAFGLGEDVMLSNPWILDLICALTIIAAAAFLAFICYWKRAKMVSKISIALIFAGAVGNLVDRMMFREVRDFIQIRYFGLDLPVLGQTFAVFNVADACLVIGIIIFAVYFLFVYEKDKKLKEEIKKSRAVNKETFGAAYMRMAEKHIAYLTKKGVVPAAVMTIPAPPPAVALPEAPETDESSGAADNPNADNTPE